MDGLKTIYIVVCISTVAFAYNCIQRSCLFGSCTESECPVNGTNGCEVSSVAGLVSQSCSETKCVPTWLNVSRNTIIKDCCFTEKCNIESMTSTIDEPDVDQCYSGQCDSEGCLQQAIRQGNVRLCRRSPTGNCMFSKIDGDQLIESAICAEDTVEVSCVNGANYNFPDGMSTTVQCCTDNLCNNGIQVKQPDVDYCYVINCNGTGCIDEAVANNVYAFCPQTGFGCMTTITEGLTVTSCSPQVCTPFNMNSITIKCCNGDLCNGPPAPTPSTSRPSSSGQPVSTISSTTSEDTSGANTFNIPSFVIYSVLILLFYFP